MPIDYGKGTRFWKPVGGHAHCILVRGRWYWVGAFAADWRPIEEMAAAAGVRLIRVQGTPAAIQRLYNRDGARLSALMTLPQWTAAVGVGGRQ